MYETTKEQMKGVAARRKSPTAKSTGISITACYIIRDRGEYTMPPLAVALQS